MNADDAGFTALAAAFWKRAEPLERVVHAKYQIRAVRKPYVVLVPRSERATGLGDSRPGGNSGHEG
jgi:hypothetical protein